MELKQAITGRRSIRSYTEQAIAPELLQQVLYMAIHAPTGGNLQPWLFGLIEDKILLRKVEAFSPGFPKQAAAVIACCSDDNAAVARGQAEHDCAIDVAMAGQNLQLAAYEAGLGSCVVRSFNRAAVSTLLRLPPHICLHYLISLGYAACTVQMPPRKPLAQLIFYDRWEE